MRSVHFRSISALAALAAFTACSSDSPTSATPADVAAPLAAVSSEDAGTYLVRFKGNDVPSDFNSRVTALGGQVVFAHKSGIAAVSGLTASAADKLAAASSIAGVDPDAYTVIGQPSELQSEEVTSSEVESPTVPSAATRYPRQWNMRAIQADVAWAAGKLGSSAVKVGIIDTGIDYLHPDLVGRVDLVLSKSFLSAAENARVTSTFGPNTPTWVDLHYHGTHVAATAASNAYIAAGVTSMTKLVALRVCTPTGSCSTSAVLGAILYAADNGIPIVNMSLGGDFLRRDASARGGFGPSFIATINQVMSYANRAGMAVVVSAGNSGFDLDHDGNSFKAYCSASHVICVSATGPTAQTTVTGPWANIDAIAPYSNFGRSAISVAAPGGSAAAVWAACSGFSIVIPVCRNRFYNSPTSFSGFIVGLAGTSMAAPHASGVAALIAANGETSPSRIKAIMEQTADDLGENGTDPYYGKGRINAARASGAIQ